MKREWTLALAVAVAPLAGCETVPDEPMSYETCATSRMCTVRGRMTAVQAGPAWMGRLELPDGRCVAVSLPGQMLSELQERGPTEVTVRGRVYDIPENTEVMTVDGRSVGIVPCGSFVLFVYD